MVVAAAAGGGGLRCSCVFLRVLMCSYVFLCVLVCSYVFLCALLCSWCCGLRLLAIVLEVLSILCDDVVVVRYSRSSRKKQIIPSPKSNFHKLPFSLRKTQHNLSSFRSLARPYGLASTRSGAATGAHARHNADGTTSTPGWCT